MVYIFLIILAGFVISFNNRITKLEAKAGLLKGVQPMATPVQTVQTPVAAPVAHVAQPAVPGTVKQAQSKSAEFAIGSKWFMGAGVLAVLLGVGFFFRYAFEHDLISEPVRVLIGVLFGGVLASIGLWLKKRYRTYGLSMVGMGLGVIYLSFYAAYALYGLISPAAGFMLLAIVVLLGIAASYLFDARQLAAAALAGGYVGVLLFSAHLSLVAIFVSLLLLAVLVAGISYRRKWPELVALGILLSALALLRWDALWTQPVMVSIALTVVLYALFVFSTLFNFARTDTKYAPWQSFNVYSAPILFFFVSSTKILSMPHEIGYLALGIAVFYAVLGLGVFARSSAQPALRAFSQAALLIVPAFLALAVSSYFDGQTRIVLLAIESGLVIPMSLLFNSRLQYAFGHILLVISGLLAFGAMLTAPDSVTPFFNQYTMALLAGALAATSAWVAHVRITSTISTEWQKAMRPFTAVLMYLGFGMVILFEVHKSSLIWSDQLTLDVSLYAILSLVMFVLGSRVKEKALRYTSYAALVLMTCVLVSNAILGTHTTILINGYVSAMIAIVILASAQYGMLRAAQSDQGLASEFSQIRYVLLVCANLAAFTVLTMEIHSFFDSTVHAVVTGGQYLERITISIFWLLYASAALVAGIIRRSTFSRQLAVVLFAIATIKVFVYDSQLLTDLYRFVSFITLGIILLIASFLYYRYTKRINSLVGLHTQHPIEPLQ